MLAQTSNKAILLYYIINVKKQDMNRHFYNYQSAKLQHVVSSKKFPTSDEKRQEYDDDDDDDNVDEMMSATTFNEMDFDTKTSDGGSREFVDIEDEEMYIPETEDEEDSADDTDLCNEK